MYILLYYSVNQTAFIYYKKHTKNDFLYQRQGKNKERKKEKGSRLQDRVYKMCSENLLLYPVYWISVSWNVSNLWQIMKKY